MDDPVKLTFNGQVIEVPKGTFLIEAAKKAGAEIPHFCYHPKLKYDANCRMCIVEVEKMPKLQTSCSTLAAEGMVVSSESARVKAAQEGVMAFLLGNHPLDCPECDQGGECQLQDFAHAHTPRVGRFTEKKRVFAKEYFGPLIEKEMNRCVSCLRCVRYCDEVLDVNALGSIDRGSATQIGGFNHHALDCEFCGGCIQICPVGALTSRLSMYDYRPWQVKKTETICNYCGDGCALTLETIDDRVIRASSKLGSGRNEGDLCARGFFGYGFINHAERLTRPSLRVSNRPPLAVTWEGAMTKAAEGLLAIKEKYGPRAIGGVISAHCTNEEIYLFQKLMREVIGTPHVDSTARYGQINAVAGLHAAFGTTRLSCYEEIVDADVLLVFAGDLTETNPIAAIKIKEAVKKHGALLIAVDSASHQTDPYRSHLPRIAKQHLQIAPGTEGAAIIGLLKALSGLSPASPFSDRVAHAAAAIPFSQIEAVTGVEEAIYREAAARLAIAKRGTLLFGRAITQGEGGYQNVLRLADLVILAGHKGATSFGILALASESNAQGAVEMGGVPEFLPGLIPAPHPRGYTLPEMLDAATRGEIKALYLVGADPIRSLAQRPVAQTLAQLEMLICQDLFASESHAYARVLFPAASYAEKEGRFTNQEGEVQKIRHAIAPVGNAKADGAIFTMLAAKLGASWPYKDTEAVWKEIVLAMPPSWPTPSREAIAACVATFCVKDRRYDLPKPPAQEGEFALRLGQSLFHAGHLSTHAPGLNLLASKEAVVLHPDDAARLEIQPGDLVEVSAAIPGDGAEVSVSVPAQFSLKIAPGTLFFPEHFDVALQRMLPLAFDPTTRVPYGNQGRVRLRKVGPATRVA